MDRISEIRVVSAPNPEKCAARGTSTGYNYRNNTNL